MFNDTWFSGTESLSGINPEWSFSGTSGEISSRNVVVENYRYGYNGMEMDNETKGEGNSYTTEFRQYDPRLGRWLSLDPLMAQFPWQSPYCAFDNNPVYFTDPLGLAAEGGPGDPEKVQQCAEVTITAKGLSSEETLRNQKQAILREGKFASSDYDGYRSTERAFNLANSMTNLSTRDLADLYSTYKWDRYHNAVIRGRGPNAVYNNKEAEENWMYDAPGFYRMVHRAAVGAVLLSAAPVIVPSLIQGAAAAAPYVASTSLTVGRYLPGAFGYSSKFWFLKASISAGSQAIINEGDINVLGVIGDGFLGYGTSSLAQSSVNYKINLFSGNTEFTSIFHSGKHNISIQQFAFESSVGIVFGYKQNFVMKGYNKNFGAGRPPFWRNFGKEAFGSSLYTLPSNGINRYYEENNK